MLLEGSPPTLSSLSILHSSKPRMYHRTAPSHIPLQTISIITIAFPSLALITQIKIPLTLKLLTRILIITPIPNLLNEQVYTPKPVTQSQRSSLP
jgi:hypothetical protein